MLMWRWWAARQRYLRQARLDGLVIDEPVCGTVSCLGL